MLSQETIAALLRDYQGMTLRVKEIRNMRIATGRSPEGEVFYIPETLMDLLGLTTKDPELEKLQRVLFLIDKMILSLDDKNRSVINCLYIKGKTYDKASEILDVSRATVANRRQRAIVAMSKMT